MQTFLSHVPTISGVKSIQVRCFNIEWKYSYVRVIYTDWWNTTPTIWKKYRIVNENTQRSISACMNCPRDYNEKYRKTNRQNAQLMRHEVGLLMILSIFMPFIILYRTAFGILWYRILRLKIEFINTHSKMADRGTWQTQSIHHTRGLIWNNFEKKIERANSNMNCLQSVTQKMPVARKRDKSTTRAALSYKKHRIE